MTDKPKLVQLPSTQDVDQGVRSVVSRVLDQPVAGVIVVYETMDGDKPSGQYSYGYAFPHSTGVAGFLGMMEIVKLSVLNQSGVEEEEGEE